MHVHKLPITIMYLSIVKILSIYLKFLSKSPSKNVKKIATVEGSGVNTYEVIKNTAVLISKDAIDEMKQVFVKA